MSDRRMSGVLVPLFSLRSAGGWGIGEMPDMARFARWAAMAGQGFLQVLPVNELPAGEQSPYSAMTAMALDPIYVAMPDAVDFAALGGEDAMDPGERALVESLKQDPALRYREVRQVKETWLGRAWERFVRLELARATPRAARFRTFVADEAWWLDDYALFRALHAANDRRAWWDWPAPLAAFDPAAVAAARAELEPAMAFWRYVQWVAAEQWHEARRNAWPTRIYGDVPFMISANSPDVWARQDEFHFDATVGVPPDAFSATGQDWGLPPWRWELMQARDFQWIANRARRAAALYDGFRLDHLVGLYRIYLRPKAQGADAYFAPAGEPAQQALGERLVSLFLATGADVVAEDLGTVPDFVRASLTELDVPGFKVLRWERRWHEAGQPFIDPLDYPVVSVATTGTHDTETLAVWWDGMSAEDRAAVGGLPAVAAHLDGREPGRFDAGIRDALLQAVIASRSRLAIFPVQDLFGWPDRINTPATVDARNWTWTLPWAVEAMTDEQEPLERAARLLEWTRGFDR